MLKGQNQVFFSFELRALSLATAWSFFLGQASSPFAISLSAKLLHELRSDMILTHNAGHSFPVGLE
jgi:hypothetical protein